MDEKGDEDSYCDGKEIERPDSQGSAYIELFD
jgi:hypothetical protein